MDAVSAAAGETVSQLPPETLVVNETSEDATDVVKLTGCCREVVDPWTAVGVQEIGLAFTVGGGVPEATIVALVREKTVAAPPVSWAVTCPVTPVEGMEAGTLLIMAPVGMVTAAVRVARLPMVQLLMSMVSGAPTLSVSATVTAAEHFTVPNAPTVNDTGGPV
jgi:hypothetical protein